MSATQTFSVIVLDTQPDFVLGIGSTQLLSGASATVPFKLQSGLDLTNVQWVLAINNDRLTNLALQNLAGQVGTAELLPLGSNRYFARFASRPDSVLQGNLQLASLTFDTVTNAHSAVAQLVVESLAGSRASAAAPLNIAGGAGRVVIVALEPILDGRHGAQGELLLTLFGKPGSSYEISYNTNLAGNDWVLALRTPQTNLTQELSIGVPLPQAFYRAADFAPDPPLIELRGLPGPNAPVLVYGRRGSNYVLETVGGLGVGNTWSAAGAAAFSNAFGFFGVGSPTNNATFFRVRRP